MDKRIRQQHEATARLLLSLLGKSPDEIGLVLDMEGWVEVKTLLQATLQFPDYHGLKLSRILDLQWALDDCPFEYDEKRIRIRPELQSRYSSPVRQNQPPPAILYYGCRRKPYPVYLQEGIHPPAKGEIILARDKDLAQKIGERRDPKPILVKVNTAEAIAMGTQFYGYGDHLFLADFLPAESLSGPPIPEEDRIPKKKPAKPAGPQAPHPDSFKARPWVPQNDRLLARDETIDPKELKRQRQKKRIAWKDALHDSLLKKGKQEQDD